MIDERINNNNGMEADEQEIDFLALLFKYFFYWRWFVASILICCVATYLFLRYQTPVYNISSSVLIKEEDKRSGSGSNPLAAIQDLGMFSMTNNFDNEVEILKSRTLIKKVVNDLDLNVRVVKKRAFGYAIPLYKDSPVRIYMTPEEASKLEEPIKLELAFTKAGKLSVKAEYVRDGEEQEMVQAFDQLPAVLPTPVGVLSFTQGDTSRMEEEEIALRVTINTPIETAEEYMKDMSVSASSQTTTIAKISVKNTVKDRGVDFVNRLVAFYNQDAIDEKNEVAQKTAEFIEERIGIINHELGAAESELADFKQRSGLTDLTNDARLALQESSKYEQQRVENATQIRLVQYLYTYINDPVNREEIIPANVGLQDQNLTRVIEQYNTMIVERKRLLRTSSETNPAVINMNAGIDAMRRSVETTVNSVLQGLQIAQKDIERQATKFEGRISNTPKQEKEFMTISRQQEIKATLYIMLLQKREENAITLASTANNGRIVEEPLPGKDPVAPRKLVFLLAAFVVGLFVPVGIIFIVELLKYKIENRGDVEQLTSVPILGELPLVDRKAPDKGAIVVRENRNDIMEETFRGLRTNLLFMLRKDQRVILVTSSLPGEGKSFVAGNLAVSLAFLGKKVIVVGMDIRKPGLNKIFGLSKRKEGISNYLMNSEDNDLFELVRPSGISPNVDILLGGTIPPNPTELVARDALEKAIEQLKARYDYVLLDTAPIGMVTDTAIIGRVADMCVYVCRADVTPKAAFCYINVLQDDHKFDKLAVVINGIDLSKRKNTYGYGYGKKYGYGYGKHYGYGYGYGYGYEVENKKK